MGIEVVASQIGIENIFLMTFITTAADALVLPIQAAPMIFFYYDLRVRKEAFDLDRLSAMIEGSDADPAA